MRGRIESSDHVAPPVKIKAWLVSGLEMLRLCVSITVVTFPTGLTVTTIVHGGARSPATARAECMAAGLVAVFQLLDSRSGWHYSVAGRRVSRERF